MPHAQDAPPLPHWTDLFPLTRPLEVFVFTRTAETLRVVHSVREPESILVVRCPPAPEAHEPPPGLLERVARLSAGADLILHDVAYLDKPERFTLALRAEAPNARLVVLSADPFHLNWVRRFPRSFGAIDGVMGSPLSPADWRRLVFGILARRVATPQKMQDLLRLGED